MQQYLLGWVLAFSAMPAAADNALELGISVINDTSRVLSGGVNEATTSRTLGAASLSVSMGERWTLYADALMLRGDDGADDAGNLQAYSNIDESEFSKVYELWAEHRFADNGLRLKFGRVDANTEFAFTDHAGEFIHSSMGVSPTLAFIPTYPTPALSVNAFYERGAHSLGFGVYADEEDSFDEQFFITQWQLAHAALTLRLGAWHQGASANSVQTIS